MSDNWEFASVWAVPRNDLAAATRYYEERGAITGDEMRVLLMLQDDSDALLEIASRWNVK